LVKLTKAMIITEQFIKYFPRQIADMWGKLKTIRIQHECQNLG
jgi:hypothetical protein